MSGAAVLLFAATAGHCQNSATPREVVNKQQSDLSEQFRQTDMLFSKFDNTVSPGCALAILHDGEVIYKRGYGMADLDHNVPITSDTVFHVASMSKQFTAAAVLLLSQEGKLSLDDEVHKYLPELPNFGSPITIRELMHHTSGIRDQWDLLDLAGWRYSLDLITDQDVMNLIDRQKDLNFKPGDHLLYDNSGYTLLSQIVRKVSGQSLRAFTSGRVFSPLGMQHTHFRDDHAEVVKDDAYGYIPSDQRDVFRLSITNFDTVGATGLLTTVGDLALWDENFYRPRVGTSDFVKLQLEPGRLNDGGPAELDAGVNGTLIYASGLMLGSYRGLRIVEHSGIDAGYRSDLVRFPDKHFSVVCLCNRSDATPAKLDRRVADIFLARDFSEGSPKVFGPDTPTVPISEQEMTKYKGLYLDYETGIPLQILVKNGSLFVESIPGRMTSLLPLGSDVFGLKDSTNKYQFHRSKDTEPWQLSIENTGGEALSKYSSVTPFNPSPTQLKGYTGVYKSGEVDTRVHLIANDHSLILERAKNAPSTFKPTVLDSFENDAGVNISFQRDIHGAVTGFLMNNGRTVNFRFDKELHE